MDIGNQSQVEDVSQNLRKQLALSVRTFQWSYAIFWSMSSRQPGVLEWGDGYYNGDIKTRKTVQSAEVDTDPLGLQRTDQLRELYGSLALGEINPQAMRPRAALSPEDLTDAEWYFLVCMSFVFNANQGLPGRTFANNHVIWLCNAHRTDTKIFSRALLAKSSSIQTIVCFPHSGGVVELGTTELVSEDLDLIRRIQVSFLESSSATVPNIPIHVLNSIDEALDYHTNENENGLNQLLDCPGMDIYSPTTCSDDFADNLLREESNLVECGDGEASQMQQPWQFTDDAISNCLNNSLTSCDSVSQTCADHDAAALLVTKETSSCSRGDTQECNQLGPTTGFQGDENHYHSVLSNLLKSSHQFILDPYFRTGCRQSSFIGWRKEGPLGTQMPQNRTCQSLLKKVLFEVARMHEASQLESGKRNGNSKPHVEESDKSHVLSERKRREKMNERFTILGSLIPSGGKVDKVSILDQTIEYLRGLEQRVEELESYKETMESESTKSQDASERTSDNYGPNKPKSTNKRKACEMEKTGSENNKVNQQDNISIDVIDKDVFVEMRCCWKECVLLQVLEAIRKLRMDVQTVQSSETDGMLSIAIKAKSKGLRTPSAGVIRQALRRVIKKC